MSFECLENFSNNSIFIDNEKQLKKYRKKIRLSNNPCKIKEFQDAIKEYEYRNKKLVIKKKHKLIKNKVESDDYILDKAIEENNGYIPIIVSDRYLKEQRRIKHMKIVNKKKIESNINSHVKHCMRKYISIWKNMISNIQCKNKNKIDLFKYTQKYLKVKNILKKWQFHSDFMITRYNMKCGYIKGKLLTNFKKNIFISWHMISSKIQCSICYDHHSKDNIIKTDCRHEFCSDCINNWSEKCFKGYNDATCPLCRQVYEYRPINYREPTEQYQETLITESPLNVRRRLFENTSIYENIFMTREYLDSLIPEPRHLGNID